MTTHYPSRSVTASQYDYFEFGEGRSLFHAVIAVDNSGAKDEMVGSLPSFAVSSGELELQQSCSKAGYCSVASGRFYLINDNQTTMHRIIISVIEHIALVLRRIMEN